jgi:hypothetical protein
VDGVHVSGYARAADAHLEGDEIAKVFEEPATRGRGLTRVVGVRLYWLAEERSLTTADRRRFNRVIAVAEGRR